jgi:hypothetical protein
MLFLDVLGDRRRHKPAELLDRFVSGGADLRGRNVFPHFIEQVNGGSGQFDGPRLLLA